MDLDVRMPLSRVQKLTKLEQVRSDLDLLVKFGGVPLKIFQFFLTKVTQQISSLFEDVSFPKPSQEVSLYPVS